VKFDINYLVSAVDSAAKAKGLAIELGYESDDPVLTRQRVFPECPFQQRGDTPHGKLEVSFIGGHKPICSCAHPRCANRSFQSLLNILDVNLDDDSTFNCLTDAELMQKVLIITFLIDDIIVEGETCFVAGGYKTLKTSIMLAMAIALATGVDFLGFAKVLHKRKVLFMSGESGLPVLQETAARIYKATGSRPNGNLIFCEELPKLDDPSALDKLKRTIARYQAQVLIIDPIYLCFGSENHGNLFEQGKLLAVIQTACREAGVTPILAHHNTKASTRNHKPPQLSDMSQSGFAEFAAQWLLLGRREDYRPGEPHKLWLSIGGRAGHSSLLQVEIDEGSRPNRIWNVIAGNGIAALEADRLSKQEQKILERLAKSKEPLSASVAAKDCGDKENQLAVLRHLVEQKKIKEVEKTVRKKTIYYYEAA
jgi:hypothetical protein